MEPTKNNRSEEAQRTIREYGVKPCDQTREQIRRHLEAEREKFLTIERLQGRHGREEDLSR